MSRRLGKISSRGSKRRRQQRGKRHTGLLLGLSNPASAMPVSPTLSVYIWTFERWSARVIVFRGVRTAYGQPETQGTQRLRRPTLYRAPELVETHQEVQA